MDEGMEGDEGEGDLPSSKTKDLLCPYSHTFANYTANELMEIW